MKIDIKVEGADRLGLRLARWAKEASNFNPVWPKIERRFNQMVKGQFESLGTRGGEQWKPLTERYRRWKERKYPGLPMLVLSGNLKGSLTGRNSFTRYKVTNKTWSKFSVLPYASRQHRERPIIQPTQEDRDAFAKIIATYIKEQRIAAGLKGKR